MQAKYKKYKGWCHAGAMDHIIINNKRKLTLEQHRDVLKRIVKTIESEKLNAEDCDAIGAKSTTCNWGMCSDRVDHYPSAELHTFPKDFDDRQRQSPLEPHGSLDCPMRERRPTDSESDNISGCFFQCRVFQNKRKTPSRIEALDLYHAELQKIEERLNE